MGGDLNAGLRTLPDTGTLTEAAGRLIEHLAGRALTRRGTFTLVLAGGSTPRGVYERLANASGRWRIDWRKTQVFFGDERCVPPDDEASNYHMARRALLDRVPIQAEAVHRIRGELDPVEAAVLYEKEIRRATGTGEGEVPGFDLILLGMGSDGHTASLFLAGEGLGQERRLAVPATSPKTGPGTSPARPRERVTLTLRAINAAREVLFLVAGSSKAPALARVMAQRGDPATATLPAALVQPAAGRLHWYVDQAAARLLQDETS